MRKSECGTRNERMRKWECGLQNLPKWILCCFDSAFRIPHSAFITMLMLVGTQAFALNIDFETPPLAAPFDNGADGAGGFNLQGVQLNNDHHPVFGSWVGWSLSRVANSTTPGFSNQYAAFPGGGAAGSQQYAVAFSGEDGGEATPVVTLPVGWQPTSAAIANTTYAARSMLTGDGFAKKFGGDDGTDPDWFRLTIHGLADEGTPLTSLEYYLADYRGAADFLLASWTTLDLSPLRHPLLRKLDFRFASSDVGDFGMNTPAYVALDNLVLHRPGDFNGNDALDAADFTVWRDNGYSAADYFVWRDAFGPSAARGLAVPEPGCLALFLFCVLNTAARSLRTWAAG
jgi:hypothetical protein